jgi:A/G-specific adenine glycosylase
MPRKVVAPKAKAHEATRKKLLAIKPASKPRAKPKAAPTAKARPASPKRLDLAKLQAKVLGWFGEHGRAFPWRKTRDPYRTMVAEVMLQQTQTGRVAPTYDTFLEHFPTLQRLAHAPAMDVIQAWRGLGYNRRAVDLHRSAQTVEQEFGGVFPSDPNILRKLPGLGEYTSSAIACFAFDEQVPVVDTNVRRVIGRAALGKDVTEAPPDRVTATALAWLPAGEAYEWNQALMDVGAMVCRVEHPLCAQCPLATVCVYRSKGRHKRPTIRGPAKEPFKGSRRQTRGSIVDHLRRAARKGVTLGDLSAKMHPDREERDLGWLVEILERLEEEGLASLTPAARRGSPRGLVRLPR